MISTSKRKRINVTIEIFIILAFCLSLYIAFQKIIKIDLITSIAVILSETFLVACMWGFFILKIDWLKDINTGKEIYHLNISNVLSAIRFSLVPMLIVMFGLVSENTDNNVKFKIAIFVFTMIVCLTDLFDGILARKLNEVTKLGMVLDPVGDFLMITCFSILIFSKNIIDWQFFILIMIRIPGLFILMVFFLITDIKFKLKTTFLGRATIFYLLCFLGISSLKLFIDNPFPFFEEFILITEIIGSLLIVLSSAQKIKLLIYYLKNQKVIEKELSKENIQF